MHAQCTLKQIRTLTVQTHMSPTPSLQYVHTHTCTYKCTQTTHYRVTTQGDLDSYPELDLDDVMKIDESSREQKLEVSKHSHTYSMST